MSTPMTPKQRVDAFTRWGVKVHTPNLSWIGHHRPGAWGDVKGVMIHHTGDDAPDGVDFNLLWHGRSDLKGPLCHWGMGDDGRAWMVGNGRASHAGIGSSDVLTRVISENYGKYLSPGPDDTDGNPYFYGQETMYSGGHGMTSAAYAATIRVCAAICHFHSWTGKSVIGHKEWTRRKPDPGRCDMADLRADVDKALEMGPRMASTFPFKNG